MSEREHKTKVKVVYQDGDHVNVISGFLIEDDGHFITIEMRKYKVKINLDHVFKIEHVKPKSGEAYDG
jgi:transcription antitermination factor NusG